jgi:UDP-N-acetylmuramoyl-tripeptide--D-alanyl-D-alanine ligase
VIGPAHLELVGSVAGVAQAKSELLAGLPSGALAVVPADASELEPYLRDDLDLHRVPPLDDVPVELSETGSVVRFAGRDVSFPLTARHQLQNALTALEAYAGLGLPLDRVHEGAAQVEVSRWRGEELELPGGGLAINDAYNANPTSTAAALRHLRDRAGSRRTVAVLGGMAELGSAGPAYHEEIGRLASELGIEVLAVGELARDYDTPRWVPDAEAALAALGEILEPGDVVLVKASRAIGLEGIAPALTKPVALWSES